MKKLLLSLSVISFLVTTSFSQKIVRLYEGKAPGSEDWNYKEIEYTFSNTSGLMVRNVVDPTLAVYMPEKSIATGTAVLICPGGGNVWLSYASEGTKVAEWLVKKGVVAFVLKYRLKKTPEDPKEFDEFAKNFMKRISTPRPPEANAPAATPSTPPVTNTINFGGEDGLKAMEFIRDHSDEYKIDPSKVGIMGFSAGAGVTMYVILNSVPEKQPNFAGPIYGGWLRDAKVPDSAPPLFIAGAADDPINAGAPDLFKAWIAAGKSAELHIYSKGGHGFGMRQRNLPVDGWIDRFYDWMKTTGF